PISTSTSTMVSPSSRRLNLTVPCDAGCEGPIWISMISSSRSVSAKRAGMRDPGLRGIVQVPSRGGGYGRVIESRPLPGRIPGARQRVRFGDERLTLADRVVLAQRMPDELGVHEDAAQVRVTRETDAEHVPHLAFRPQRTPPHAADRRDD